MQFPWCTTRSSVLPEGVEGVHSLSFGLVHAYMSGFVVSKDSRKFSQTLRLVCAVIKAAHTRYRKFPFTSIQVNFDYAAKRHVDANNLGPSLATALGEFTGGKLQLDGSDDLDMRNKWVIFNGNTPHSVRPFQGERYSLVAYTCDHYDDAAASTRRTLRGLGLNFPTKAKDGGEQRSLRKHRKAKQQLQAERAEERYFATIEEKRTERVLRGQCHGRTWAKGWGGRCTAASIEGRDLCEMHHAQEKGSGGLTHGRFDGHLPKAKRAEMKRAQEVMLAKGEVAPESVVPLSATLRIGEASGPKRSGEAWLDRKQYPQDE